MADQTTAVRFIDHRQLIDGRTVQAGDTVTLPAAEAADHVRNGVAEYAESSAPPEDHDS